MLAEPVAQPLRFAAPHLDEARPQRLDDVDLVAVDHHALAQLVQLLAVGAPANAPAAGARASR